MTPGKPDRLDTVETVMWAEEFFKIEISDKEAESIGSPRALVDVLENKLSNSRPNHGATMFLQKLADDQQRPELAEGLDHPWRREQISAIVREMIRNRSD